MSNFVVHFPIENLPIPTDGITHSAIEISNGFRVLVQTHDAKQNPKIIEIHSFENLIYGWVFFPSEGSVLVSDDLVFVMGFSSHDLRIVR